jgi:hypothetical protein
MHNWSSSASSVAPTPYNLRPPPGDVDKENMSFLRELIAGDDNVIFNEEDDYAEDADYLVENIDLGREALEGLLLLDVGHVEEM